jgi:large-conductance mechanosensitive channel
MEVVLLMVKRLLSWIIFCVVGFLATGWATDFSTLDIQLHDTYFVIPLGHLFLAIGLWGIMFLGLDWLSQSNKAFTFVVFLLNTMLFLLFASAAFFTWRQGSRISTLYPPYLGDPYMKQMMTSLLAGMVPIAVLQMMLAIRALWRIRNFRSKDPS